MTQGTQGPVVLVVDDEVAIRRFLRISLEASGYCVLEATTGQDGLGQTARCRPDVVILDLGLPDMTGLTVLKRLREWSRVPVIVLTVQNADADKIALLDAGADDYLTKPFSLGELLARLRLAQRHAQPLPESSVFVCGSLTVDTARRIVSLNHQLVKLTATEYSLLRLFIQNAGKVLTHRQILREVWGPDYEEETQYLRVYIANIRRKLEADPAAPQLLVTEPGVGYRLVFEENVAT